MSWFRKQQRLTMCAVRLITATVTGNMPAFDAVVTDIEAIPSGD